MRWQRRRESTNVEDRRGMRHPAVAIGLVLYLLMGGDPLQVAELQNAEYAEESAEFTPAMEQQKKFVAV